MKVGWCGTSNRVGSSVGTLVDASDGAYVGVADGKADGTSDGVPVCGSVGANEGACEYVGVDVSLLGKSVGEFVGPCEGCVVGTGVVGTGVVGAGVVGAGVDGTGVVGAGVGLSVQPTMLHATEDPMYT